MAGPDGLAVETPPEAEAAAPVADAPAEMPPPAYTTPPPLPPPSMMQTMDKVAAQLPRLPRRLAWSLVILLLVLMTALFYAGRHKLVMRFPTLESFYVAAGWILPPAVESFDIELTQAEKCLISGRDMLCLAGHVVNKSDRPLAVPTIYITALNAQGREFTNDEGRVIFSWIIEPEGSKLLPGESKAFNLTKPYPDKAVTDFDYGFTDDTAR